jgi:hypothetical protein
MVQTLLTWSFSIGNTWYFTRTLIELEKIKYSHYHNTFKKCGEKEKTSLSQSVNFGNTDVL